MKRNKLAYKKLFIDSVKRGLADANAGRVHNTEEVREVLQKRRDQRRH
jgi:predicted transcriptional regulator